MEFLFYFLGGVLIGIIFAVWLLKAKTSGILNIIRDEDGEYMYVELKHGISDVRDKYIVKFIVKDHTQK